MARVLLLSPYHGGSHAAFARDLARLSRHEFRALTLPARFWKWRMRGAALELARRAAPLAGWFDLVLATDMMNVAEFRALAGGNRPHVLYLHENQIGYPLPAGERPDLHFGFINLSSALAARKIVFNSRFHRDTFFGALPGLIHAMPDCRPRGVLDALRRRTRVLPVVCDLAALRAIGRRRRPGPGPPVILWNHRWEFDKDPEAFFRVLAQIDRAGLDFRLVLLGENSQAVPKPFLEARRRYGSRILRWGYAPSRAAYAGWLAASDIVISTALQENFGVAVVEAVAMGAWPLLPRRLSYPEILPRAYHADCLYEGERDLEARLGALLRAGGAPEARRQALAAAMDRLDGQAVIGSYDDLLDGVAAGGG